MVCERTLFACVANAHFRRITAGKPPYIRHRALVRSLSTMGAHCMFGSAAGFRNVRGVCLNVCTVVVLLLLLLVPFCIV